MYIYIYIYTLEQFPVFYEELSLPLSSPLHVYPNPALRLHVLLPVLAT